MAPSSLIPPSFRIRSSSSVFHEQDLGRFRVCVSYFARSLAVYVSVLQRVPRPLRLFVPKASLSTCTSTTSMDTFRDRKKSTDSVDEFRKRSATQGSKDKKWRKDAGQLELRCCINPELLRSNVDKHWFFEDEQVRVNGSVFTKRENYDNLLSSIPKSKFNGIHIKMEDDCPQGGDDVRLCLLKTLGAHNQRNVPCVACQKSLTVYDRYPLIDGTFFLTPVCHYGPPIEVMYEGRRLFLQQICAECLWSDWKCCNCGNEGWFNGKAIILGTLYYYDIISSGQCCPPSCSLCRSPLLVPESIMSQIVNGNYQLLHELITCSACGCKNFHCVRRISDCAFRRDPSSSSSTSFLT